MVGTAGLPHIIVRFYTVPNVRAARYSAGWALLFIALLYTTAPALAAFARYNLINTLHGKTDRGDPAARLGRRAGRRPGCSKFDDKNGDGVIELTAGQGHLNEMTIDRDIIVLSTPEVAGSRRGSIALVAAGGLAAALSTAAGLLLVISSSIAHDIYAQLHQPRRRRRRSGCWSAGS